MQFCILQHLFILSQQVIISPFFYNWFLVRNLIFSIEEFFGRAIYIPIAPPQRTKMGPQKRLGIYIGYESLFIIKYLEPLSGDLFTA